MQHDLRIKNFRGFREFSMAGLGRLNLLVGTNNCGKTTVLEAIHFLSVPGSPGPLWQAQLRRGELIEGVSDRQLDVSRLVHGYRLEEGSGFYLAGDSAGGRQELAALFWVMPDNVRTGMLETLLLALRTGDPALHDHARDATHPARTLGAPFRDNHREKAELHVWLAWQDPPGRQLHEAVRDRRLLPAPQVADPFVGWFRQLFEI